MRKSFLFIAGKYIRSFCSEGKAQAVSKNVWPRDLVQIESYTLIELIERLGTLEGYRFYNR